MFHFHGQPVSPQDAIDMLRNRKAHRHYRLKGLRRRDELEGTLWRQLWAMIRGRL